MHLCTHPGHITHITRWFASCGREGQRESGGGLEVWWWSWRGETFFFFPRPMPGFHPLKSVHRSSSRASSCPPSPRRAPPPQFNPQRTTFERIQTFEFRGEAHHSHMGWLSLYLWTWDATHTHTRLHPLTNTCTHTHTSRRSQSRLSFPPLSRSAPPPLTSFPLVGDSWFGGLLACSLSCHLEPIDSGHSLHHRHPPSLPSQGISRMESADCPPHLTHPPFPGASLISVISISAKISPGGG